jgi:hypothetical protein
MADTKQGREKKALAREKRQQEWEIEVDLDGMDDPDEKREGEGNA